MESVTVQLWRGGAWRDAALLEFPEPERGAAGPCDLEYDLDYFAACEASPPPSAALSLRLPVVALPTSLPRWPSFLDDIRPLGGARAWWVKRLALRDVPADDVALLRTGAVAPIGNLRIREAVPERPDVIRKFRRQDVVDREAGFLEYAAEQGAQVGGATGAGGDSPKLLLRLDGEERVWIDSWQDDPACADRHYLVKFARERNERARDILRSEFVYYKALHALGMETIDVESMRLEEGAAGPSLWLPRFDVQRRDGRAARLGMESIFSIMDAAPASWLEHESVLAALRAVVAPESWSKTLLAYVQRDLLNVVFGNSDNHGRNIAVLKTEQEVRLAPIFDFAPMKMDLEGITRTTRWARFEKGGDIDWQGLLKSMGEHETFLRTGVRALAERLADLPSLLADLGLPRATLDFPSIGLTSTAQKLKAWGLL
jgi:serine/threonine-protein kinase HipA